MPSVYRPRPVRVIGTLVATIGGLMLLGAVLLVAAEMLWLARATRTTGRVVEVASETMRDGSGRASGTGYRVVFRFTAADGRTVTARSSLVSSSTSYRPGDPAAVDYHSDRPDHAQLARWIDRWLAPAVLGFIGAIFSLIGGLVASGLGGTFRGVRWGGATGVPGGDLPPPRRR